MASTKQAALDEIQRLTKQLQKTRRPIDQVEIVTKIQEAAKDYAELAEQPATPD